MEKQQYVFASRVGFFDIGGNFEERVLKPVGCLKVDPTSNLPGFYGDNLVAGGAQQHSNE